MDGLATVCTHSPFQDLTRSFSGRGMYHNSATHPEGLYMIVRKRQTWGGDRGGGGIKNNRRGRLLKHTNEFTQWSYQCDFCAKLNKSVNWQKVLVCVSLHPAKVKQPTSPPLNLLNDNKIDLLTRKAIQPESYALSGRMWSFAEPLGSHSPCTELKTHYSEQLHCYNNTLLNSVPSEHFPSGNVRIHIMVMLRNTRCDVTKTSIGI